MIDASTVRAWEFPVLTQAYAQGDAMLYALSLGYGSDPQDARQLRYVYERGLEVVPTFANVLGHPGFWISDPRTGIDATRAVHGEHRMRFHAPLPPSGTVQARTRVLDVLDKGPGKGALLVFERVLSDAATGQLLATLEQHTMCRGDGGFSGAPVARSAPVAPEDDGSAPDFIVDIATLPQAALLHRLGADRNPLHADPEVARAAGFERPILHGLCTFGVACRAVLQACTDDRPARLSSLAGRFSAPVYPGETLRTLLWDEGNGALRLRCLALERGVVVLSRGTATVSP